MDGIKLGKMAVTAFLNMLQKMQQYQYQTMENKI